MRVATDELVGDGAGGLLEVERLALAGQLAVEDDLQQQVAALLEHLVVVVGLDGVDQLVHLLDGVETDRFVILLAIPRATAGAAQARHDLNKFVDRRFLFFGFALGWHVRG